MRFPPPRLLWVCCLWLVTAVAAFAADGNAIKFDLPAGDAEPSLKLFSDQSGQQVIFPTELVRGVRTNAVEGSFTAEAALNQMLDGTGLEAVRDETTGAFALRRRDAGPNAPGAALPPASGRPTLRGANGSEVVQLNPFEVKTNKDTSYGALNSNSLTQFNTELSKTPVVADIFTQQFMEDTQVQSVQDLFAQYGAGAGTTVATPSSDSQKTQPGDRFSVSEFGIRGVSAGTPRRDGFDFSATNTNATSVFDIERVDVLHGSQGLLYGATGPGGVINIVSKEAKFGLQQGKVEERIDQYGSKQTQIDDNIGNDIVAVRVAGIDQRTDTRRLYIGDNMRGYYGQIAVVLPFNTVLRFSAEETHDDRVLPNNITVNYGGTSADPRSGDNLGYLLASNQVGAINPATGQAFSLGAIDNGHVDWKDYLSYMGWRTEEDIDNTIYEGLVQSRWTDWLSTQMGFLYDANTNLSQTGSKSLVSPPVSGKAVGGNPFNDWAMSSSMSDAVGIGRKKSYRISALISKSFFDGRVDTHTAVGFDREYADSASVGYGYYLAAADGSVPINVAASNLGRTAIPTLWWTVGGGPVQYPYPRLGAKAILYDGSSGGTAGLYVRMPTNPRSPAWVTRNNPLGLASLYEASLSSTGTNTNGVSGSNGGSDTNQARYQGYYLANYTSWFDDAFESLLGFRISDSLTRNPNTNAAEPQAWLENRTKNLPSFNAGLVSAIPHVPWARPYIEFSRTFDIPAGGSDPYGVVPQSPNGYTYEGGIKFTTLDRSVSGYVAAFKAYSTNRQYNAGGTFQSIVNDPGLNGAYIGPEGPPGGWARYDQTSRGIEAIFTGQEGDHFRWRLAASVQDGTVERTSQYGLLYNDQFFTDGKGNVTYAGGQPFLVPTDQATLTKVSKQTSAIDPATYGVPLTPLTLSMINDPTSPYYAFATGTAPVNPAPLPQNQPLNGAIGSGTTGSTTNILFNALQNFQSGGKTALTGVNGLPISAIQYNWADPAGYHGNYVVQRQGDATIGYPIFAFNLTGIYTVREGWLTGFASGGSIGCSWYNRMYWFQSPDQSRGLWEGPIPNPTVNAIFEYRRKFGRIAFHTQLNINNVFNHYNVAIFPNNGTAFSNAANVNATFYGVPRQYVWSNRFDF